VKLASLAVLILIAGGSLKATPPNGVVVPSEMLKPVSKGFSDEELRRFTALEPVDTHTHIYKSDPAFFAMLRRLHLHTMDIVDVSDNANPERKDLAKENADVFGVARDSNGHVAACTTFDPYRFSQPGFTATAIRQLDESFKQGAIAAKVWKSVGMEVKDAKGNYILPDDPSLEPIYKDIATHHKTLVTHVADLDTAWGPLDPNGSDSAYFVNNPQWYMYKIPGSPSKQAILRARDHVLEMNPNLRMVGAHLGSMEADINQVAQHLDRYSNFAVDLAGRMHYLMVLPRAEVIAFITKYQDRIIYGTDNTIYPETDVQKWVIRSEASYAGDWRFLATDETLDSGGHKVQGLALPHSIVHKLYHDNAAIWIPGVVAK
jgi:predicted TIM-barrel fold metal-dependent hydrolase